MDPPPACAIKIHWFHLSNNNHPQLEVFHNNLNCQHLGTFCSQDWWWWWWVRWWVGCQVHYVCMISAAVEILQQPNHQVETWDLRQGLMIRSRLERRGLWLVMGLLMRVAAKHDCKKRLVSHTFSVRARGGRGHLSWKSLANKKDQEKIKNTFSIVKHALYIPFLLMKRWVELSWVEGKIPTQRNFCNWYFFLSAPTTHWYHHLLELRPLRS
jgi:hypothetical protein